MEEQKEEGYKFTVQKNCDCTLEFNKAKDVTPLLINLPIYFYVLKNSRVQELTALKLL